MKQDKEEEEDLLIRKVIYYGPHDGPEGNK